MMHTDVHLISIAPLACPSHDMHVQGDRDHLDAIDYYTAGFITGAVSAFVEGPIDFYKSQLQVQACLSSCLSSCVCCVFSFVV